MKCHDLDVGSPIHHLHVETINSYVRLYIMNSPTIIQ